VSKLNDYFSFSRGEKRGVVILFIIIILLIVGIQSIDYFNFTKVTDFSEFENAINQFEKERNSKLESEKATAKVELFDFNPNTISDSEWIKLGFENWQIKTINNYKAKGGFWRTKSDVRKIYGLDSNHYNQLKPFILLPDNFEPNYNKTPKEEDVTPTYFEFNPNTISELEWKKLGFKDWQIKTIFNYKAKGGSWSSKADVKKIYGLAEADYFKLEPYILLPYKSEKKQYSKNKNSYTKKVDINTADAKELTNLKGIYSEKYAAIIIKHRDKLGGFTSKEQLKEVWNMTEETYNGFINQVIIGKYEPKKININSSSASQLQEHPYIDWKTANAIYKFRKANGNYQSVKDIKKIHLINEETYIKISPYLTIK
tara:strand:+ start:4036 stop:5148 length:1113 start_codon:yes stop_codon:yes gene_type:complete